MKPLRLLTLLAALAAGSAGLASPRVAERLEQLHQLVILTDAQRARAQAIFQAEAEQLVDVQGGRNLDRAFQVRESARAQIRELLTAPQRKVYDRAPMSEGGGLTLGQPAARVARLEEEAGGLTEAQKRVALQIYREEFESLVAIAPADRLSQGGEYRQAAREQIQSLLTAEQRATQEAKRAAIRKKEAEESAAIVAATRAAPQVVARFGGALSLRLIRSGTTRNAEGETHGSATYHVRGDKAEGRVVVQWRRSGVGTPVTIDSVAEDQHP